MFNLLYKEEMKIKITVRCPSKLSKVKKKFDRTAYWQGCGGRLVQHDQDLLDKIEHCIDKNRTLYRVCYLLFKF